MDKQPEHSNITHAVTVAGAEAGTVAVLGHVLWFDSGRGWHRD